MRAVHDLLDEIWYGKHPAFFFLAPLGWAFRSIVRLRRAAYINGLLNVYRAPVPVIVVGNLSVGGTGKTPLVIWLARRLQELGFHPGIIARGYGGTATRWPQQVRADSDPMAVGDEAVLIARRTGLPIAVGPNRSAATDALLTHADVNIIVSDDGLQHYALARDIEIAVLDGVRRFGNGACLPAGPLREPRARMDEVDLVVTNGLAARGEFPMRYESNEIIRVVEPDTRYKLEDFEPKAVHAVAGVGVPDGFFSLLRRLGFRVTPHAFRDHHRYTRADLDFGDAQPLIMTEKDAVKCGHFATNNFWYVPVSALLPEVFELRLKTLLKKVFDGQEIA